MDTGNRFERDPRSGTQQGQQAYRDDTGLPTQSQDDTGLSGDQYAQQGRYGQTGLGSTGQQRSDDWGQGRTGAGRTSETSSTSAQYGGSERSSRDQTGGYSDPTTGGDWQRDDDETTGTGGGKPTMTGKVKGTAERMAGKVTGDPAMQARGEERKEGLY